MTIQTVNTHKAGTACLPMGVGQVRLCLLYRGFPFKLDPAIFYITRFFFQIRRPDVWIQKFTTFTTNEFFRPVLVDREHIGLLLLLTMVLSFHHHL